MIEDRLQDLIMPAKESGLNFELWLGLALVLFMLALVVYRWQKQRNAPFSLAQKKLANLIQFHSQQADNKQQTALALVTILCQGFSVKRLDQIQTKDDKAWAIFQNKLNTACYSTDSQIDIHALLNEAKDWMSKQ